MEQILNMSVTDKILLLNEIKKNYSMYKTTWTDNKIDWFEKQIKIEIQNLGNFNLK